VVNVPLSQETARINAFLAHKGHLETTLQLVASVSLQLLIRVGKQMLSATQEGT
jgi:hypothetical protein